MAEKRGPEHALTQGKVVAQMTQLLARLKDGLDPGNVHFVDVQGVPTRYYRAGSGEPLVLFHGGQFASLYSLDSWSLALPALAGKFEVFAIDKLGQGYTGNPAGPEDCTFDALLKHSIATLDALGIKNAHLAGHSRGALLVAAIALSRPDLAKTVLAVSTNTLAPDDQNYPGGQFYAEIEKRTPPGPPTRETVRMEPDAQAYSNVQVTDDFVQRLLAITKTPGFALAKQMMDAGGREVWMASLASHKARVLAEIDASGLPCPTLITWGANDKSAFLPLAYQVFDRIRAKTEVASLHVINHSGHYVYREQTAEFVATLEAFCYGRA